MAAPSKNILWLTISRVVSLGLLFFAYTQLFRYLGPEGSGQFQFALAYATLFGVIIDFGIQQYVIKKISEDKSRAKLYFHNFLAVEIVIAFLVFVAMNSIAYFSDYELIVRQAIFVIGLGVSVHGLTYPFLAVLSAYSELKRVAFLNFLSSAINVSVMLLTIWLSGSIVHLAAQQIIYAVIALCCYYRFVQKYIGPPNIMAGLYRTDFGLVKKILKAALPFAMLVGFSTIYNRIDVVLIGRTLGYIETGFYTAAYKFFDLLAFFPAIVSHSLYPVFASLMARRNFVEVKLILEKYLRFMIALALPIATGAMILSEPIIKLLAGEEFLPAAKVLSVLVWAPAILFVYIVVNSLMISQLTKFATIVTGINVLINVVGNLILLPRVGIIGAAIMTLVSETIQGIFYFYIVRKKIVQFSILQFVWQPLLASAIMGVIVYYFRNNFFAVPVLIGFLVYAISLLLLGFFKKEDFVFIGRLFRASA